MSRHLTMSTDDVYQSLLLLTRMHVLHYIPRKTTPYIHYPTSREEPRYLVIPTEVYERQRERMERRAGAMKEFAFTQTECRSAALLRYFGEEAPEDCGKCDVCRDRRRATRQGVDATRLTQTILYKAGQRPEGVSVAELIALLSGDYTDDEVVAAVRALADRGELTIKGTRITL